MTGIHISPQEDGDFKMKKNMKRVFFFYSLLFVAIIAHLLYFAIFEKNVPINSYNPRLNKIDNSIKRGMIFDTNGITLAETVTSGGSIDRAYYYPEEFCHIIGYMPKGKSGLEAKINFTLQKLDNELLQRLESAFSEGNIPRGNNVFITIDSNLQHYIYKRLGKSKGAVVVMEPKTGKILSMVSYPSFDPLKIERDWEKLKNDDENSPLLNRATQGLYPPGSTFKILTAGAEIETDPNYENFSYTCRGEDFFDRKKIRCFNSTVHGKVNISDAVEHSCNTFFATIGQNLGSKVLSEYASKAMFNSPFDFTLEYNKSSFTLSETSKPTEVVETAIGQGKTLVSPLHMAMITSSVANKGIMMKPYIIERVESCSREVLETAVPTELSAVFTEETSLKLTEMMKKVVDSGTGTEAKIKGINIAGKTGTAENPSGADHAWFTAFAPAENPEITVTVLLENAGNGSEAIPLARDIIEYILK